MDVTIAGTKGYGKAGGRRAKAGGQRPPRSILSLSLRTLTREPFVTNNADAETDPFTGG